jgi:hypothetical protein
MRYELTDDEWTAIKPMLPNKPRGVPRVNDRRVLNGIFWVLRSGAPWRDLPGSFGPYTTCYNRFVRWRRPSLCPSLAPASLVELPSVRMRRVHSGLAWVTEHPTGKARHQEENHERDRRDSEVAVGAARSFPPFC